MASDEKLIVKISISHGSRKLEVSKWCVPRRVVKHHGNLHGAAQFKPPTKGEECQMASGGDYFQSNQNCYREALENASL